MTPGDYKCQWEGHSSNETFQILFGDTCTDVEDHMFVNACWSDSAVGGVCLAIAFVMMVGSDSLEIFI